MRINFRYFAVSLCFILGLTQLFQLQQLQSVLRTYQLTSYTSSSSYLGEILSEQLFASFEMTNSSANVEDGIPAAASTTRYPVFENGIDFGTLLDFVYELEDKANKSLSEPETAVAYFPESLYIVDSQGVLWRSKTALEVTKKVFWRGRVYPSEEVARRALIRLGQVNDAQSNILDDDDNRWPRLEQALTEGGFPYLAWYGDFIGCNHRNWRNLSVPLFTTCAKLGCNHAIPAPAYKIVLESVERAADWAEVMERYDQDYASKINRVVWRGSLTGALEGNVRWNFLSFLNNGVPEEDKDLFDAGFTKIPPRHNGVDLDLTQVGGLVEPIYPMEGYQQYTAILDIDGNSWSSRFGKLLCYNSIVLKVEPGYVEYFYKDLIPGVHYLPVAADLSNLVRQAQFALDPANEETVQEIISNANDWCREFMTRERQALDYLDIWEAYLELLDEGDPKWIQTWRAASDRLLHGSPLAMEQVFEYKGMQRETAHSSGT